RLCRFQGRGHGSGGDKCALRYLARRLRLIGYHPKTDTFPITVWLFDEVKVWLQDSARTWYRLREGIDFLPTPGCPSVQGEWEIDSLPIPHKAWRLASGISRRQAYAQGTEGSVSLLLFPQAKLTAALQPYPDPLPGLSIRAEKLATAQKVRVRIRAHLYQGKAHNLTVHLRGRSSDSAWVLGAHYDHIGRMGRAIFWGANDNASGTAFMLNLASHLYKLRDRLPYDVWMVFFAGEESGLLGSSYWVQHAPYALARIRGMLNFDLMGFGEKGVAVVGASDQPALWQRIDSIRRQIGWEPPLLLRPNAPNSDHYPFRMAGVPALFFYLQGGPGFYHDPYDRPETITWHSAYSMQRWVIETLCSP
ncbi:MAG: M28 family peptidase, partial [Bacteroidia bacterium]|nr:M28 family peptidase [Bacteroidia bacterium]